MQLRQGSPSRSTYHTRIRQLKQKQSNVRACLWRKASRCECTNMLTRTCFPHSQRKQSCCHAAETGKPLAHCGLTLVRYSMSATTTSSRDAPRNHGSAAEEFRLTWSLWRCSCFPGLHWANMLGFCCASCQTSSPASSLCVAHAGWNSMSRGSMLLFLFCRS